MMPSLHAAQPYDAARSSSTQASPDVIRRLRSEGYVAVMSSQWDELRRVLPIATTVELASTMKLLVVSIELWSDRLVLHTVEQLPGPLPPGPPIASGALWNVTDDIGTQYLPHGGSGAVRTAVRYAASRSLSRNLPRTRRRSRSSVRVWIRCMESRYGSTDHPGVH